MYEDKKPLQSAAEFMRTSCYHHSRACVILGEATLNNWDEKGAMAQVHATLSLAAATRASVAIDLEDE
jgi:hypothetical protein